MMRFLNVAFFAVAIYVIYFLTYQLQGAREALLTSAVIMMSSSIILAVGPSNDAPLLLLMVLAIYFMVNQGSSLTGLMIGLGTVYKLSPALLIFPASRSFRNVKEKVRLLGAAFFVVFLTNLPFIMANPHIWGYTYFGGIVGRGPWETVWAVMDGWYGHGGAEILHPSYENFFTYDQMSQIYPPSRCDHEYYLWKYSWLPSVMTLLLLLFVVVGFLLFNEKSIVESCSFMMLSAVFFSKGYSPQYTVWILPLIAISVKGLWKIALCILLDIATVFQMMVWSGWQIGGLERVPNLLESVLTFSVFLRTGVLLVSLVLLGRVLMKDFRSQKLDLVSTKNIKNIFQFLSKKRIKIWAIATLVLTIVASTYLLWDEVRKQDTKLSIQEKDFRVTIGNTTTVPFWFEAGDRVIFSASSDSQLRAIITKRDKTVFEKYTSSKKFKDFFIANESGTYFINLEMVYPSSDFQIVVDQEEDAVVNFESIGDVLQINVKDLGKDGKPTFLRLMWDVNATINSDFETSLEILHVQGRINRMILDLINNEYGNLVGYEFYPSEDTPRMEWHKAQATPYSPDSSSIIRPYIIGMELDRLSLVLIVDDDQNVTIQLRNFEYRNQGQLTPLNIKIRDSTSGTVTVYSAHRFSLTKGITVQVAWPILIASLIGFWVILDKLSSEYDAFRDKIRNETRAL
jgi:hypothetical protein